MQTRDGKRSFDAIEERFGRIVAYQVAEQWPIERNRPSFNQKGAKGGTKQLDLNLSSIAEYYLDPAYDLTSEQVSEDQILPMVDCNTPGYLQDLNPELKDEILEQEVSKCLDLSQAKVSGGTLDGDTEHILVIMWQKCASFKPREECASAEELEEFVENIQVHLTIAETFIDFHVPETDLAINKRLVNTQRINTRSD